MTKEEFHTMEKPVGMTLYVIANVDTCKAAGKLVKVFKDSVILDFTAAGIYNNVDHRLFRCEEISATPVTKTKSVNFLQPKYRCEEAREGRAFKAYYFTQLGGI